MRDVAAIQENDPSDRFLIFMARRVFRLGQPVFDSPRHGSLKQWRNQVSTSQIMSKRTGRE